jgi:putative ATP-dependent endonuclease of OLD family
MHLYFDDPKQCADNRTKLQGCPSCVRSLAQEHAGLHLCDLANGANKIREIATGLKDLRHNVSVLADSDRPDQFSGADADELRAMGVTTTMWNGGVSIERRVFADLPWPAVKASFEVACRIHGDREKALDQIQSKYGQAFDRNSANWTDAPTLRDALGNAAEASEWYKRQSWAQQWVSAISPHLDDATIQDTDLSRKICAVREWIDCA